jgi:mono/diheme cytochrome c family protein
MRRRLCREITLIAMVLMAGCRQQQTAGVAQTGQDVYNQRCAMCHGANREGIAPWYPPLARSEWVDGPPSRLAAIVLDGLQGRSGKFDAVMPGWGGVMQDPEIASVMTWLRAADGKSAVTAVEVTHVRVVTGARGTFWTEDDLRNTPIP